jgi:anion-transporting  ArsA/GET3 family ATPase
MEAASQAAEATMPQPAQPSVGDPVSVQPVRSLLERRLVIVTGKGGTGKTTVSAALSLAAASAGRRVLAVEVGPDEQIPSLLEPGGAPVGYAGRELRPGLEVMRIEPFEALAEYLGLQIGVRSLVDLVVGNRSFRQLLAAAPGWRELITLGKIWHLSQLELAPGQPRYEMIIVDAPATGHGVSFLEAPRVVVSAVRAGPLRRHTERVEEMIEDSDHTLVLPVALAEELPTRETAQLIARVRDEMGIAVDRVIVNAVMNAPFPSAPANLDESLGRLEPGLQWGSLPEPNTLAACAHFLIARHRLHSHYEAEIGRITNLPCVTLPYLPEGASGIAQLERLSVALLSTLPMPSATASNISLTTAPTSSPVTAAAAIPAVFDNAGGDATAFDFTDTVLTQREILVCVGCGGVGKTTVAASLALEAARRGRRALVLTIDPAQRLADALGVTALGNRPESLARDKLTAMGVPEHGSLHAVMLDMKRTFDDLVDRFSKTPAERDRVLGNAIYQHASDALAGSVEYSAMEKVFELHQSGEYDLIVVDTPPAQHALDFLDAPARLLDFLDSRLVALLIHPAFAAGRFGFRLFQRSTQRVLQLLEQVTGLGFLEDISEFLLAFEGMADGFRERAHGVRKLILGPTSAFVLVTGAGSESVRQSDRFLDRLEEHRVPLAGAVVNRIRMWPGPHPRAIAPTPADIASLAATLSDSEGPEYPAELAARAAADGATRYADLVRRDAQSTDSLRKRIESQNLFWGRVPEFEADVHSLANLGRVADWLSGRAKETTVSVE